jgi:hypothetical protein
MSNALGKRQDRQIDYVSFPGNEVAWLRRKVAGLIPDEVIGFLISPNPSSRTMGQGSTKPLTEISTRNLSGGKERPAHKADNLIAICKPIV